MGVIKVFFILIVLFPLTGSAQPYETNPDFNRTRNWHFGYEVGLHFTLDTILFTSSKIEISETSAIHTDINGNLLLYSNGQYIWDASHNIIHNGNLSLGHYSSRQGSVFIFHEDNPNYIYLINTNYSLSANNQLSYNLIVKEADTFRVVFKDSVLQTSMSEPIAVVKAENGKDIWIVTHVFNGSNFVSYILTKEGIVSCPVNSNSKSYVGGSFQGAQFAMSLSADGKYLIKSNTNIPLPTIVKSVELYEFNQKTGKLIFLYSIDSMQLPVHGITFSKSYNNIYIIERDRFVNVFNFYPYDRTLTVKSRKQLQVQGYSSSMSKYEIQNLTYTNQLALAVLDSTYLAVLNDHKIADSISLVNRGISLHGKPTSLGLPNFVKSYFYTPSINFSYVPDCILNAFQFQGQDTFNANVYEWLITKQNSIPIVSNLKSPFIEFKDTGIYNVRYIASNGSRSDTIIKEVEVYPHVDSDFLGSDSGWCEQIDSSIILQAPGNMFCYEWSTGETTPQITVDAVGVYIAKITTPNFCVIYDTVTISLDTNPNVPVIYIDNDSTLKTDDIYPEYKWFRNDIPVGTNQPTLILNDTGIYHLQVKTTGGCTALSDTLHVLAEKDTFIDNVNIISLKGIKLYPNPINDYLTIELEESLSVSLLVYDITGRLIIELSLVNRLNIIDTRQLVNGLYNITLVLPDGQTINRKLIKHTE